MKKRFGGFTLLSSVIFFLNVFIALAIISGSWLLVRTEFGKTSLIFGFVMLIITTFLKFARKW